MKIFLHIFATLLLCYFIAPPIVVAKCKMSSTQMSCCKKMNKNNKVKMPCCKKHPSKPADGNDCGGKSCAVAIGSAVSAAEQKFFQIEIPSPSIGWVSLMMYFTNDTFFPLGTSFALEQPPNH